MDTVINFINENEKVVMTALFIMIILLTAAVFITDYISKKRVKDLRSGLLDESNTDGDIDLEQNEEKIEKPVTSQPITEIKYVDEDSELEKTRAQIELKNLKDELIKADKLEKEREKQRQLELEKTKEIEIITTGENVSSDSSVDKIDEFEKAQEENAIISLDQFNKVSDRIYESNEVTQYKDEGNEPISIAELEKLYNSAKEDVEVISEVKADDAAQPSVTLKEQNVLKTPNIPVDEFKFKKSPIISPVYGIDKDETLNNISVENTANLDKLSEEIKKTNEFLNALKELRKNL